MAPSSNGRSKNGRFQVGNPGGPGNPHAAKISQLRAALLSAVTPTDIKAVIHKLIELAKSGDLDAMKLLLDRVTGKPSSAEQIELPTLPTKPTKSTIAQTKRRLIARIHALNPDLAEADAAKPTSS